MAKKSASKKKAASKKIKKFKKVVNAKADNLAVERNTSKAVETGTQKVDKWITEGEKEYALVSKAIEADKVKLDKEMKKRGLDYNEVGGIIAIVVGVFLILMNLTGLVLGAAGILLIYFGLRMLERPIHVKR